MKSKIITTSSGDKVLIDEEDFELVSKYKWQTNSDGYATTNHNKLRMHRLIMQATEGEHVDHINGNRLDNRKSNLRLCTNQQNQFNVGKRTKSSTSKYKGVFLVRDGVWRARIRNNGKVENIGTYSNEDACANAYNYRAIKIHGKFAMLNDVEKMHPKQVEKFKLRK